MCDGVFNPPNCPSPPSLLTSPELGLGRGRGWTGLEGEVGVRLPSSGTLLYLGGRPGWNETDNKDGKQRKKERWRGGKKTKTNSLYDIPWKGSLRWLAWDRGAVREEEEEEEESEAQIAVLVQETGSMRAEAEHENNLLQSLWSAQHMDQCQTLTPPVRTHFHQVLTLKLPNRGDKKVFNHCKFNSWLLSDRKFA